MTTYEEWRVTGLRGQPFSFTWTAKRGGDPERSAKEFIRHSKDDEEWRDGPYLSRRTVTITEWEVVESEEVTE